MKIIRKLSLKVKTVILVTIITLGISLITTLLSAYIIVDNINDMYNERVMEIARTGASQIDVDDLTVVLDRVKEGYYADLDVAISRDWESEAMNDYLASFSDVYTMPEFERVMDTLRSIQDTNSIDCIYIIYIDRDNYDYVYIIDAALPVEDACPVGLVDPIYIDDHDYALNVYYYSPAPNISNSPEYGHLITGMSPVYNDAGDIIAHVSVDISMNEIIGKQRRYTIILTLILLIFTLVAIVLSTMFVEKYVVKPVGILSEAAGKFIDEETNKIHNSFAEINIRTGDEIEVLSNAMKQMESNLNNHIDSLVSTREKLSRTIKEANKLESLANRDSLTGVRNKYAYEAYVESINKRIRSGDIAFAVSMIDLNNLKTINDSYGHEKGDIAIKNVCALICDVFTHSAVFRIGGDEFAAISENHDYVVIQELVHNFQDRVEELSRDKHLEPWEQTSAAIGYSIYDFEKDSSFIDTFKRADAQMYDNKQIMKKAMKNRSRG